MDEFSAFGTSVNADFRGTFANAAIRDNVVVDPTTAAVQSLNAAVTSEIGWSFALAAGRRAIFVRYSATDERPCELVVNDVVVQAHSVFETTERLDLVDWRYQCHADFGEGDNHLSIRCLKALPHIYEIAIVAIDQLGNPTVEQDWQRRAQRRANPQPRRPLIVTPADFRGVVDTARKVANDEAAVEQMSRIAAEVVRGVQIGAANGQAMLTWGGPLNGQRRRQMVFAALMRVDPDAIIETGTYLGASTAFFARQGLPVHTCESQSEYYAQAIANLAEFPNVHMHLQDSRSFLSDLADDRALAYACPLFYLDAHWYNDLPLAAEIAIIRARWPRFMIMVDDFEVPGERGYGFDRYADGLELTLDYLRREAIDLSTMAVMFPTATAASETSVKRGTLMLSSLDIYDQHLRHERGLFRHDPPPRPDSG